MADYKFAIIILVDQLDINVHVVVVLLPASDRKVNILA